MNTTKTQHKIIKTLAIRKAGDPNGATSPGVQPGVERSSRNDARLAGGIPVLYGGEGVNPPHPGRVLFMGGSIEESNMQIICRPREDVVVPRDILKAGLSVGALGIWERKP